MIDRNKDDNLRDKDTGEEVKRRWGGIASFLISLRKTSILARSLVREFFSESQLPRIRQRITAAFPARQAAESSAGHLNETRMERRCITSVHGGSMRELAEGPIRESSR